MNVGGAALKRKVIFLDIDGVVVTRRSNRVGITLSPRPPFFFDSNCVSVLKKLVEMTGAELVVSSTWRRLRCWKERIKNAFSRAGWDDVPISERTPVPERDCPESEVRGEDIALWLEDNPVYRFLILDDGDDMLPDQLTNFVQTSMEEGLTKEHLEKCCEILAD